MKVVTVTANSGFVRAARGQGLDLAVILHESRALTEDKMNNMASSEKLSNGKESEAATSIISED